MVADQGLQTLLAVALVSAIAPMVVSVLPGPRIPQVIVLIFGGIGSASAALGRSSTWVVSESSTQDASFSAAARSALPVRS